VLTRLFALGTISTSRRVRSSVIEPSWLPSFRPFTLSNVVFSADQVLHVVDDALVVLVGRCSQG